LWTFGFDDLIIWGFANLGRGIHNHWKGKRKKRGTRITSRGGACGRLIKTFWGEKHAHGERSVRESDGGDGRNCGRPNVRVARRLFLKKRSDQRVHRLGHGFLKKT